MKFSRVFAMPSRETFSIPPIADILDRWVIGPVVVDPFARNSNRATITNDLDHNTLAQHHLPAEEFVKTLAPSSADQVIFDPPYSPRQIAECYKSVGLAASMEDTQDARLARLVKDGLCSSLRVGGIAVCCGWNSMGFGINRGFIMLEILLVCHGGQHNDTIVTVERKVQSQMF